jgi:hypothetical protein
MLLSIIDPQRHRDREDISRQKLRRQRRTRLHKLAHLICEAGAEPNIEREARRPVVQRGFDQATSVVSIAPYDKVFNKLDVLANRGKDGRELLISHLKNTEGCVLRSIDDLYVFQRLVSPASANANFASI